MMERLEVLIPEMAQLWKDEITVSPLPAGQPGEGKGKQKRPARGAGLKRGRWLGGMARYYGGVRRCLCM